MTELKPSSSVIKVDLHSLTLSFLTPDRELRDRFETVYGHLPRPDDPLDDIQIRWDLYPQSLAPDPPASMTILATSPLISHYRQGNLIAIRLPKYALVSIDLDNNRLRGQITAHCLETYGAFEDVLMIALAPLYRRRGWFPLHAFAAQAPNGKAALLTGDIGAGKTTTGLALLNAGWKLLSNDSPLLRMNRGKVEVLAYPGQLSAFDDSLARFEVLQGFIPPSPAEASGTPPPPDQKRIFRAEAAFPEPWATTGEAGGLFFPNVVPGLSQSRLLPLSPAQALLQTMPQLIERWDQESMAQALHLARQLVEQVPSYILELAPDMDTLPPLIGQGLGQDQSP